MVDCPVDQWTSCDDRYRSSEQHAEDVAEVINTLRRDFGAQQVMFVGTSYERCRVHFSPRIGHKIDGAIHTATFSTTVSGKGAHGAPMRLFDWSKAKVPQLFVHHKDDPCDVTRYSSILSERGNFRSLPLRAAKIPGAMPAKR